MRGVTGDDDGGLWAGVVLWEMSWEMAGVFWMGGMAKGMAFHSNLHLLHHRALFKKLAVFADKI